MFHTILLVDDNHVIRRMVRSIVEQQDGWLVCGEAENGIEAVSLVKEFHPDVVVLDLQMPVMNGLEAARQITQIAPGTTIVMLTMHYSKELLEEAESAGIERVLSKVEAVHNRLLASLKEVAETAKTEPAQS